MKTTSEQQLRAACRRRLDGEDLAGLAVVFTTLRPKGCWLISGRTTRPRLHLIQDAFAAWLNGSVRMGAFAVCGATSTAPEFPLDPPEWAQLCDRCVLADELGPVVYRFLDRSGQSLYIGSTSDFLVRLTSHAGSPRARTWLCQVDRVEIERYPSRGAALAAEIDAIDAEDPPFNTQYRRASRVPFRREDVEAILRNETPGERVA